MFKKIYDWFNIRFSNQMPPIPYIDQEKISRKLNQLNAGLPTPEWLLVEGQNTFTGFDFDQSGKPIFLGNSGYPVKLFVNSTTSELKIFPLALFISYRTQ